MKLALALAVLLSGASTAATPTEWLSKPEIPGFVSGYEASNHQQSIREWVPQGETVQAWTRMVTDQRLIDFNQFATPERFAEEMAKGAARSCPGATTSPVKTLQVSGRAAARMRADCPNNPDTDQPEVFWILLIAGARDIHVRQVAFRRIPNAKDAAWAEAILNKTRLCTKGQTAPGC